MGPFLEANETADTLLGRVVPAGQGHRHPRTPVLRRSRSLLRVSTLPRPQVIHSPPERCPASGFLGALSRLVRVWLAAMILGYSSERLEETHVAEPLAAVWEERRHHRRKLMCASVRTLPDRFGCRASNSSSVAEYARLEMFSVLLESQGCSECHAASSRIEIKPFLSPNSTIKSRSADAAVRMQHVQSSV